MYERGLTVRDPVHAEIARAVDQILRLHGLQLGREERRNGARLPLKTTVSVVPVDDRTGRALPDQAFAGLTTNVSSGGIGLAMQRVPDTLHVVISFWKDGAAWMHLLCEPRWIRFTTRGFHWVGCRIRAHLPPGFVEPPGPPTWTGPDVEVEDSD